MRRVLPIACALLLTACQPEGGAQAKGKTTVKPGGISEVLRPLRPQPVRIPEGTTLPLALATAVSSATSRPGDLVIAKLSADVRVGDKVALPAGTEFRGRVTTAVPSGRVKGRAQLAFDFESVTYKGKEYPIETRAVDITAPGTGKRDAAIIGGGAAAGGIVGAIVGGKKGAGIGVLVGAGAGTGTVLATKGKEVTLPAGTVWHARLQKEAVLQ